jgi:hypothetical protein
MSSRLSHPSLPMSVSLETKCVLKPAFSPVLGRRLVRISVRTPINLTEVLQGFLDLLQANAEIFPWNRSRSLNDLRNVCDNGLFIMLSIVRRLSSYHFPHTPEDGSGSFFRKVIYFKCNKRQLIMSDMIFTPRLFPSTSFPVRYSLFIQPLGAKQLAASSSKQQTSAQRSAY